MQTENRADTICAISTPIGEGGISIIRLSGPDAIRIADLLFQSPSGKTLHAADSHTIQFGTICKNNEVLDEVLVSVFKAPHTYTKEDIVEINTHGGLVITRTILESLITQGARMAEPGEFTKRAFINGRIDLTQAEAVIDLIKAKSDVSAKTALKQLEGRLSHDLKKIRELLTALRAHIETFVDFPEEEDRLYADMNIKQELTDSVTRLQQLHATYQNGAVAREGVHTVIVGKPNVGKSSLLNVLLNRDRAIVSDYPGTTRDALEELIEIDGILFRIVDTAGIMQSPQHELDYLSIEKTRQHYEQGDLIIIVLDASQKITEEDKEIINAVKGKKCIVVCNKIDQGVCVKETSLAQLFGEQQESVFLSVKSKEGVSDLEKALANSAWHDAPKETGVLLTRIRQKNAVEKSLGNLSAAQKGFEERKGIELVAYDIQQAVDAVKELIGEIYTDDVLNVIFSEFCIGK